MIDKLPPVKGLDIKIPTKGRGFIHQGSGLLKSAQVLSGFPGVEEANVYGVQARLCRGDEALVGRV